MPSHTDRRTTMLDLDQIVVDKTIHPRQSGLDEAHLESLLEGHEHWPPLCVEIRDEAFVLVDGFHRMEAARLLKLTALPCEVWGARDGDLRGLAVSLNTRHGKPLTLPDRKAEAQRLLRRFPDRSDRAIAERCGLSDKTVGTLRAELEATAEIPQLARRVGLDGKARQQPANPTRPADKTPRPPVNLSKPAGSPTPAGASSAAGGLSVLGAILKAILAYVEDYASDGIGEAMLTVVNEQYHRPAERRAIQDALPQFAAVCAEVATRLTEDEDAPDPSLGEGVEA